MGAMPFWLACVSAPSTTFMHAVEEGDVVTVEKMLKENIGVVASSDMQGHTAWHIASKQGSLTILQALSNAVVTSNEAYVCLNSMFDHAMSRAKGGEQLVARFLSEGSKDMTTPIMLASAAGHAACIEFLIEKGADRWQMDVHDRTALHYAVRHGHANAAGALLRDAPLPPKKCLKSNKRLTATTRYVDVEDIYGWAPLHYAALRSYNDVASVLLSDGANLTLRTVAPSLRHPDLESGDDTLPSGMTPLHLAAYSGNLHLVKLLLRCHYESTANLPAQLLSTGERQRSQERHDPRLYITRSNALAFNIAHQNNFHSLLEWLDPSVPLMFLFGGGPGVRYGDLDASNESYVTPVAAVPRLTLLAAAALHQLLMSELAQTEALMVKRVPKVVASAQPAESTPTTMSSCTNAQAATSSSKPEDSDAHVPSSHNVLRSIPLLNNVLGRRGSDPAAAPAEHASSAGTPVGLFQRDRKAASCSKSFTESQPRPSAAEGPPLTFELARMGVVLPDNPDAMIATLAPIATMSQETGCLSGDDTKGERSTPLEGALSRPLSPLFSRSPTPLKARESSIPPTSPTSPTYPMSSASSSTSQQHHCDRASEPERCSAPEQDNPSEKSLRRGVAYNTAIDTIKEGIKKMTNKVTPGEEKREEIQTRASLLDEDYCPICLETPGTVIALACHHTLCLSCARHLCNRHKITPALCPCCRAIIRGFKAVAA